MIAQLDPHSGRVADSLFRHPFGLLAPRAARFSLVGVSQPTKAICLRVRAREKAGHSVGNRSWQFVVIVSWGRISVLLAAIRVIVCVNVRVRENHHQVCVRELLVAH